MTPCPPSPDSTILRSILGVDTCHPRPHSSGRRGSGRVDHYRNVPAILSNMAPRPPTVAAVTTHGVSPSELSVACEGFALDRPVLVARMSLGVGQRVTVVVDTVGGRSI